MSAFPICGTERGEISTSAGVAPEFPDRPAMLGGGPREARSRCLLTKRRRGIDKPRAGAVRSRSPRQHAAPIWALGIGRAAALAQPAREPSEARLIVADQPIAARSNLFRTNQGLIQTRSDRKSVV